MLMNRILETYREITGNIPPVATITTVSSLRPAANADNITESDTQARRHRRQRRMAMTGLRNISGWSVRSW